MRELVKKLLATLYPKSLSRLGESKTIPILCYHSVNAEHNDECFPLTPSDFRAHLEYLSRHHNVISLRQAVDHLRSDTPLPDRPVVLTFDDGYRDNFEVALPLLEEFKCHATFFIVSGFVEGRVDLIGDPGWEAMSLEQMQLMDESAFAEIAAHTDTHRILAELPRETVRSELKNCQSILQQYLNRPVDLFAYPFGQGRHIAPSAPNDLKELGFIGACSTLWRSTQNPGNLFMLNRIMINRGDDVEKLKQKIFGSYDYLFLVHKLTGLVNVLRGRNGVWR